MRKYNVIALLLLAGACAYAQTPAQPAQKIGYADWNYIFSQMPEFKQIDSELQTHSTQLESQLQAKLKDYETKLKVYQEGAADMLDVVRQDKELELTRLQENITKFQQDAQASLQRKQNELMEPVFTKVGKTIEAVAKEQGYSFILNPQSLTGEDIILYGDSKYDISDLVLKKMGITPQPEVSKQ